MNLLNLLQKQEIPTKKLQRNNDGYATSPYWEKYYCKFAVPYQRYLKILIK